MGQALAQITCKTQCARLIISRNRFLQCVRGNAWTRNLYDRSTLHCNPLPSCFSYPPTSWLRLYFVETQMWPPNILSPLAWRSSVVPDTHQAGLNTNPALALAAGDRVGLIVLCCRVSGQVPRQIDHHHACKTKHLCSQSSSASHALSTFTNKCVKPYMSSLLNLTVLAETVFGLPPPSRTWLREKSRSQIKWDTATSASDQKHSQHSFIQLSCCTMHCYEKCHSV